jgi:hypothetical protein
MTPRDEAAIANAMLLGDFTSRPRWGGLDGKAYSFDGGKRYYDSVEHAAWMYLCRLGYGIESNGTGLVRLTPSNPRR